MGPLVHGRRGAVSGQAPGSVQPHELLHRRHQRAQRRAAVRQPRPRRRRRDRLRGKCILVPVWAIGLTSCFFNRCPRCRIRSPSSTFRADSLATSWASYRRRSNPSSSELWWITGWRVRTRWGSTA